MRNHFTKKRPSIKQGRKIRKRLLAPFIKKYRKPVLVHSTNTQESFKKILIQGKLKVPSDHKQRKKTPYMEELNKTNNHIYYSLGFLYVVSYDFKYSLIFNLDYLKELEYYKGPVQLNSYKKIVSYILEKDPTYLYILKKKNKTCKEIVRRYLHDEYKGKTHVFFEFWKDEKSVFDWIKAHKDFKKFPKIVQEAKKSIFLKYPWSVRHAKNGALKTKIPEIISNKECDLKTCPYFLGFYIKGKIPKQIEKIIKDNYPGKILFDGNKIKVIQ